MKESARRQRDPPTTDVERVGEASWPQPQRATRSREGALVAALDVIAERGYERLRFQDVAGRAGMSVGNLQYLFGSREAMIVAAFRYGVERDLGYLEEIAGRTGDAWLDLQSLIESVVLDEDGLAASRRVWLEFWNAASRDPQMLGDAPSVVYAAWQDTYRRLIERGVDDGQFVPLEPVAEIIKLLSAMLDGMVPLMLAGEVERPAFARSVINWMSYALGRRA